MVEREVEIINKLGLHARAAAKLVSTASAYGSDIRLHFGGNQANAKSIMSVMLLAAAQGSVVTIECNGKDEKEAMHDLVELISDYFGEDG